MARRKALRTLDPNVTTANSRASNDNDDYQPCSDNDSDYVPKSAGKKRSARRAGKATTTNEDTPSRKSQQASAAGNSDHELQPSRPTKRNKRSKLSRKTVTVAEDADEVPAIANYDPEAILEWFLDLPDVTRLNLRQQLVNFFTSIHPKELRPADQTAARSPPSGSSSLSTVQPPEDSPLRTTPLSLEEELGDILELDNANLPTSLDDAVQSILDRTDTPYKDDWWPSTDPTIDRKWDQFIRDQMTTFGERPQDFVKPSGTLSSNLLIQWHYPTYATTCPGFGLDADISNPCTRMMFKKYRLDHNFDNDILVAERIWKRFKPAPRSDRDKDIAPYDSQPEIWCNQHTAFSDWLYSQSQAKVVLLIGTRNVQLFRTRNPNVMSIKLSDTKLFGHKAWLWILQEHDQVTRIIIPTYHTEAVFYGLPSVSRQLMDVVWNLAAALIKRTIVNEGYFKWFGKNMQSYTNQNDPLWDDFDGSPLALIIRMRAYEIECEVEISEDKLPLKVHLCIQQQNFQPSPSEGSVIHQLIRYLAAKGAAAHAAAGFPGLAKGRAAHAAAGFPGLIKGHVTNAAAGHPGLAKGRATLAAAGHPELAKGRATLAANGYRSLVKGRATNAAAGHPGLAKGRATLAAAGHPELVKARATRAANCAERDAKRKPKHLARLVREREAGRDRRARTAAAVKNGTYQPLTPAEIIRRGREGRAKAMAERDALLSPKELAKRQLARARDARRREQKDLASD